MPSDIPTLSEVQNIYNYFDRTDYNVIFSKRRSCRKNLRELYLKINKYATFNGLLKCREFHIIRVKNDGRRYRSVNRACFLSTLNRIVLVNAGYNFSNLYDRNHLILKLMKEYNNPDYINHKKVFELLGFVKYLLEEEIKKLNET